MNNEKVKKVELVKSYDTREMGKATFILKYWLDTIEYKGEVKERFRYLPDDSSIRASYTEILRNNSIIWTQIRFDDHLVYVMIGSPGD